MRYVSSIPPVTWSPKTHQVKALSPISDVKPVQVPEQMALLEGHHTNHQRVVVSEDGQGLQQHGGMRSDRRKSQRRVTHLPVLEELRSGIDRRHHNVFKGDVAEHIDETV